MQNRYKKFIYFCIAKKIVNNLIINTWYGKI